MGSCPPGPGRLQHESSPSQSGVGSCPPGPGPLQDEPSPGEHAFQDGVAHDEQGGWSPEPMEWVASSLSKIHEPAGSNGAASAGHLHEEVENAVESADHCQSGFFVDLPQTSPGSEDDGSRAARASADAMTNHDGMHRTSPLPEDDGPLPQAAAGSSCCGAEASAAADHVMMSHPMMSPDRQEGALHGSASNDEKEVGTCTAEHLQDIPTGAAAEQQDSRGADQEAADGSASTRQPSELAAIEHVDICLGQDPVAAVCTTENSPPGKENASPAGVAVTLHADQHSSPSLGPADVQPLAGSQSALMAGPMTAWQLNDDSEPYRMTTPRHAAAVQTLMRVGDGVEGSQFRENSPRLPAAIQSVSPFKPGDSVDSPARAALEEIQRQKQGRQLATAALWKQMQDLSLQTNAMLLRAAHPSPPRPDPPSPSEPPSALQSEAFRLGEQLEGSPFQSGIQRSSDVRTVAEHSASLDFLGSGSHVAQDAMSARHDGADAEEPASSNVVLRTQPDEASAHPAGPNIRSAEANTHKTHPDALHMQPPIDAGSPADQIPPDGNAGAGQTSSHRYEGQQSSRVGACLDIQATSEDRSLRVSAQMLTRPAPWPLPDGHSSRHRQSAGLLEAGREVDSEASTSSSPGVALEMDQRRASVPLGGRRGSGDTLAGATGRGKENRSRAGNGVTNVAAPMAIAPGKKGGKSSSRYSLSFQICELPMSFLSIWETG